jgi:hypothetical protein
MEKIMETTEEIDFNSDLCHLYINGVLWHISSYDTIFENIEECIRMQIYPDKDDHSGKTDHIVLEDAKGNILEKEPNYIHNYK